MEGFANQEIGEGDTVVVDLIGPSVEARGRAVAGKNGASDGPCHGDRGVGKGSDAGSVETKNNEQGSPGAAFLWLERPDILARVEEDLVDAGRIGL